MKKVRLFSSVLVMALIICTAAGPAGKAAWMQEPRLAVNASLSSDGKAVTIVLTVTASDPVCALQADVACVSGELKANEKPKFATPWSGMLVETNTDSDGSLHIAAASAAGVKNSGGNVVSISYNVADGAKGTAVFYIRSAFIASADGSQYNATFLDYTTVDLKTGVVTNGVDAVPSSAIGENELLNGTVIMQEGNYAAVVGGRLTQIDPYSKAVVPCINDNGRTMVPLRFIVEALGAQIAWDGDAGHITILSGGNTVILSIDSASYTINGKENFMDTVPYVNEITGRTMVPLYFITQALGMSACWDTANHLAIVSPPSRPWDPSGAAEAKATTHILQLISEKIRNFM